MEIDPREWDEFLITYKQSGAIVLEKTENDLVTMEEISGDVTMYRLSFRLSQEDTKKFKPDIKCEVQIRCHYPNGNSFASDRIPLRVSDVLNDEVLGDAD